MKKFSISIFFFMIAAVLLLASCQKEKNAESVNVSLLPGKWVKQGTQEYWRYRSNGNGVTWDEADDITEEESNLTFTWTLEDDQLTHVFSGAAGNQAVSKVYTVTALTSSTMVWTDVYGTTLTLVRQ